MRPWDRVALWVLAVGYAVVAGVLWFDPSGAAARSPFALPGLSGRFVGCWAAFLAALAAFAAWRNRRRDAFVPLLALTLLPLEALVGAARRFDDLAPSGRRAAYLAGVAALAATGAALTARSRLSASAAHRAR